MNINNVIKNIEILINSKNFKAALYQTEKILKKNRKHFVALAYKSIVLANMKEYKKACAFFKEALDVNFDINLAINYVELLINIDDIETAEKYNEKIHNLGPSNIITLYNSARIQSKKNNTQEANSLYKKIIKKNIKFTNAFISYGLFLNKQGLYTEAINVFHQGLTESPNNFTLLYNLGITFNNNRDYQKSIENFQKALSINLNIKIDGYFSFLNSLLNLNQIEEYRKILGFLEKKFPDEILIHLESASFEVNMGNYDKGIKILTEIIKRDKNHIEANHYLGMTYLMMGNYNLVDKHYKYRVKNKNKRLTVFDDFDENLITKEDNLLILNEQGIGDQILLLRLVPFIHQKVKSITYVCDKRLQKILEKNLSSINIISKEVYYESKIKFNDFKKINLGTIFRYIDPTLIFNQIKHWQPTDDYINKINKNIDKDKIKIGIAWKSKSRELGLRKSIELKNLLDVLESHLPKLQILNLQYGDISEDLNKLIDPKIINQINIDLYNDIDGLFALVSICDLIITTSNVTAHIAGALGKKTLLLIPKKNGRFWYWRNGEKHCPWYKTIKYVEQEIDGEWKGALKKLQNEIKKI